MNDFLFQRLISVDWSGGEGKTDADQVSLRVAVWENGEARIESPPEARFGRRNWTRQECREWVRLRLADEVGRTLVALDFGFGLPWGIDRVLFQVDGWQPMIAEMAKLYAHHTTARATAEAVNSLPRLAGHGPYRLTKDDRTERRFYLDHGIGYYRLTEVATPQAISQWYLGAGPKVGYHSITGMAALHWLMAEREAGRAAFQVWPQETMDPQGNVVVESYPAIVPQPTCWGTTQGEHERDAWKVLQHLIEANRRGEIGRYFSLRELPFGRVKDVSFATQVQFEGFIFGLM
jgi:hypothetical protein